MAEDEFTTEATPIDDAAEDQAGPPRRRSSTVRMIMILGTLVVASLAGAFLILSGGEETPPGSLPSGPQLDHTPGGAQQAASPRYREGLEAVNREGYEQAVEQGESFVPTPETIPTPIDIGNPQTPRPFEPPAQEEPLPQTGEALPAPVVTPPKPPAQAPPTQPVAAPEGAPAQEPPDASIHVQQMAAIIEQLRPPTPATAFYQQEQPQADAGGGAAGQAALAAATPAGAAAQAAGLLPPGAEQAAEVELETLLQPGDMLYAETINANSSDLPSPILAKVVTGEYSGSRLVGAFTVPPQADGMVIQFATMTLPDGRTTAVNAYAIDPHSASSEVASDVDRRWLSRFGPIIAASFIRGFAESAAIATGTVIQQGDGATVTVTEEERTSRQNVAAGLSEVGQNIAEIVRQSAPTGPEIILASGTGIAVLFVDAVAVPKEDEKDDS